MNEPDAAGAGLQRSVLAEPADAPSESGELSRPLARPSAPPWASAMQRLARSLRALPPAAASSGNFVSDGDRADAASSAGESATAGRSLTGQLQFLTQRLAALEKMLLQTADELARPPARSPALHSSGANSGGSQPGTPGATAAGGLASSPAATAPTRPDSTAVRGPGGHRGVPSTAMPIEQAGEIIAAQVTQSLTALMREQEQRFQRWHELEMEELQQQRQAAARAAAETTDAAGRAADQASLLDWSDALFGESLGRDPRLRPDLDRLLEGLRASEPAAARLVGQLILARSVDETRLAQSMGDVGDAYYAWSPKEHGGEQEFETGLVAWLERRCRAAGLRNTIQLVRPGEQFDPSRHRAAKAGGGVQVVRVHGWTVLRDDGNVLTKASVSVR